MSVLVWKKTHLSNTGVPSSNHMRIIALQQITCLKMQVNLCAISFTIPMEKLQMSLRRLVQRSLLSLRDSRKFQVSGFSVTDLVIDVFSGSKKTQKKSDSG